MANTIISAVYGTGTTGIDVTQVCQQIVDTGNDDITANNATFGDPDPGTVKKFAILYTNPALNGGNPIALGCSENATIDLVPNPPTATTPVAGPGTPSFKIVHALYGTASNGFDVTSICQWLVDNGGTTIAVSNATFGGDPSPGVVKNFAIVYTAVGGGAQSFRAVAEGTTLTLS
ncbi:hypothetical protein XcuCFBP2542_15395 [Xanthomonas cucurbitae]|uniref:Uncharacterized protein n=1 Tax=Xanthomonas cucurbitae TaxID=56453 RepID=A0A2S7DKH1_9XANT|nr:hypothetical protein [Xanthomonas cucurbitae]PPU74346.1 hypothetical protein XcuCFBP2542_15395 [Xanthomonas cucurbitae]WDM79338.1 hypothetical protein K6980_00805 [Xanthomonas cucurbitae]WDM83025.1 hypothetical protein K6979_00810 [Xanthomonas cucurbitae]